MPCTLNAGNTAVYENTNASNHSFTLTIPSGTSRKVGLLLIMEATTITFSNVLFNDVAMSLVLNRQTLGYANLAELHYYDVSDVLSAGDYLVKYTTSASTPTSAGMAWCVVGAATGAVVDADYGESLSGTALVNAPAINVLDGGYLLGGVLSTVGSVNFSDTPPANITQRWALAMAGSQTGAGGDVATGSGTVAVSFTQSSTSGSRLAMVMSFGPAAGGAEVVPGSIAFKLSGGQTNLIFNTGRGSPMRIK